MLILYFYGSRTWVKGDDLPYKNVVGLGNCEDDKTKLWTIFHEQKLIDVQNVRRAAARKLYIKKLLKTLTLVASTLNPIKIWIKAGDVQHTFLLCFLVLDDVHDR